MMIFDVDEETIFRERDKGGVLYSHETEGGVLLYLLRDTHALKTEHYRPPVMTDDDGNIINNPDFLLWKTEKLQHAIPVRDVQIVGPSKFPNSFIVEAR